MTFAAHRHQPAPRSHRRTAAWCAAFAVGMLGLAYASAPLYDLFCRATGFDGTPMRATKEAGATGRQVIRVRFDANVAPGLSWRFSAEQPQIDLKPGETHTILYKARNLAPTDSSGTATFNVYPPIAAKYFNKLQCFCFSDTPIKAGETIELPVAFFLDPALETDPDMKEIRTISLSYTYFRTKNPRPVAAASVPPTIR